MGVYDDYEHVQLKVGDVCCHRYKVGDTVDIPDGLYFGYGGAVAIRDGQFVGVFDRVLDKWGSELPENVFEELINPNSPVVKALKDLELETEAP